MKKYGYTNIFLLDPIDKRIDRIIGWVCTRFRKYLGEMFAK